MNIPIESMTTAEKIEAMEQLWASLQQNPEHQPCAEQKLKEAKRNFRRFKR
jgi:Putative addiction module component